mmetsp:Transcript_3793/g.13306  ORF Transcript_3793/g.13306 Transcript_3793/m.13306 type:complete len:288 (+) Transcript_3793:362-1225(+)
MTRFFSSTCAVSCRMLSRRSSRSRWNSSWRSSTSCFAAWYLPHSFWSFAVFASASSCLLWYVSSVSSCLLSRSSMRLRFSASTRRFSASSAAFRSISFFCSSVRSWRLPCSSLLSIVFSFFSSCIFFSRSSWTALKCFSSSSCWDCMAAAMRSFSSLVRSFSAIIFSSSAFASASAALRMASLSCSERLGPASFIFLDSSLLTCALIASICMSSGSCSTSTSFSIIFTSPAGTSLPPPSASAAFRRAISSWNSRSIASFGSSLIFGLFLMFLARFAYRSVLSVSSKL